MILKILDVIPCIYLRSNFQDLNINNIKEKNAISLYGKTKSDEIWETIRTDKKKGYRISRICGG